MGRMATASCLTRAVISMMGNGLTITPRDMDGSHTGMVRAMRESGTKIVNKDMVLSSGLMDQSSKGIICAAKSTAKARSFGQTNQSTKASSSRTRSTVKGNTHGSTAARISVSGITVDSMASVICFGLTTVSTRELILRIKSMAMVVSRGQMVEGITVNGKRGGNTAEVCTLI